MWGTLFVLAPAIDWPASLELAADAMLPLLDERLGAALGGYGLYFAHSLLLIAIACLLPSALGIDGTLARFVLVLGSLAGLAKALGLARWLFAMPVLASTWVDPGTSDIARTAISVAFDALDAYAGGIGELMGVSLFTGAWTVALSLALLQAGKANGAARRRTARGLGWIGLAIAPLVLLLFVGVVGFDTGPLPVISTVAWQFWSAAIAIWLLRSSGKV